MTVARSLDAGQRPSAMTMKVATEATDTGLTMKMQVMLLYGPEVWIDVEPDTAVYVWPPR